MAVSDRFSLTPLIGYHYANFRDPGARCMSTATRLVLFGIPLALGLVVGLTVPLSQSTPPGTPLPIMVTAAGTMIAGFLASFVLLTNLRIKLHETDGSLPQDANLRRSVSMAVIASLYLGLVSAGALMLALLGSLYWPVLPPEGARTLLGLVVAVFAHIAVTTLSLVRRASGAYVVMFRGEVVPTRLTAVSDRHHRAS